MDTNLKLVTYNIHNSSKAESIIKNILNLAGQNVNFFCLQEVRKYKNTPFIVAELLKSLGPTWQAECLIKSQSLDLGLCTLWNSQKLEALKFEHLLLPKLPKLRLHEKTIERVISKSKHPEPIQRAALVGEFKISGQNLRITNLHLDWQGGFDQRSLQLKFLGNYLKAKSEVGSEVLCGDFNSLGFYRLAHKGLKKIHRVLGEDFSYTLHKKPTTSFFQTLDHIFVKNLTIIKTQIFKYQGSDHFPLFAEIEV